MEDYYISNGNWVDHLVGSDGVKRSYIATFDADRIRNKCYKINDDLTKYVDELKTLLREAIHHLKFANDECTCNAATGYRIQKFLRNFKKGL